MKRMSYKIGQIVLTISLLFTGVFYQKNYNKNYFRGTEIVRINTASKRVLTKLNGITPDKADLIIENRPFINKNDLVKNNIITKTELKKFLIK